MHTRKISFAGFPTPLQKMPNLSKVLGGPSLFVKRDDMTDLAFGGNKARKLVAETEGIFLDPVYTGKAMAALIDLIKKGYFKEDDNVVFFHTGGLPPLFLYRNELGKA